MVFLVAAHCLSQYLLTADNVQYIILNLKCNADIIRAGFQPADFLFPCSCQYGSHFHGALNQCRRLMLMDEKQQFFRYRLLRIFRIPPLRFHIRRLPADHPVYACFLGKNRQSFRCPFQLVFVFRFPESFHRSLKSKIQQPVPCQYCHALAVHRMGRLSPSAVFVIVHAGKVVMHQRISMHHFQSRHERFCQFAPAAEHMISFLHQHRAQPLPAGQHTVIHRFNDRFLTAFFLRKIFSDNLLYMRNLCIQFLFKIHPSAHPH